MLYARLITPAITARTLSRKTSIPCRSASIYGSAIRDLTSSSLRFNNKNNYGTSTRRSLYATTLRQQSSSPPNTIDAPISTTPALTPPPSWLDKLPSAVKWTRPYFELSRLDKPIGSWLLYWPCGRSRQLSQPRAHMYITSSLMIVF
jgi:hypothetical protein